ncbi:MAG: histidine kinase [Mycobacteriales bacterium]
MRWTRPAPSEVAIAAATTVVMAVDLGQAANPWLGLVGVVLAGATLAWRLWLPELPLLAICLLTLWLDATAPGEFAPQTVGLGLLVALYSAAVHLEGRRALVAAVWSLLLVWVGYVVAPEITRTDFFPVLVWAVSWLAGRLVRRQMLRARQSGARAALLEVEAREAAARERDRIARELHDVVAHAVSLMVVQAGAERLAGDGSPRTLAALDAIETSGRQALVELRTMLGVLRTTEGDEERQPQPDLSAVPALVASVRAAGQDVALEVEGDGDVAPGVGLAAYRVVQESLTNALRHGRGGVRVRLHVGSVVSIEVRNRVGVTSSVGAGRGLAGMRERVGLFGGHVTAEQVGDEWVVCAEIPCDRRLRA